MHGRQIGTAEGTAIEIKHTRRFHFALAGNQLELAASNIPRKRAVIRLAACPQEWVCIKRDIVAIRAFHHVYIVGNNDWKRRPRRCQRIDPRKERPRQTSSIDRAAARSIHVLVEPFTGQHDPERVGRRVQYFRPRVADITIIVVFARHEIIDVSIARTHLDRTADGQLVVDHGHVHNALVRLCTEVPKRCFERT